jgi:hypothetical protein
MPAIHARQTMACVAVLLALALTACSSSTATDATSSGTTAATAAASAGAQVSANTASEDEIAAALEDAGVSNPERWAEEVVEYRPYPTDDPDLTKLRDNLAKYNPDEETTDKIVSALTP